MATTVKLFSGPIGTRIIENAHRRGVEMTPAQAMCAILALGDETAGILREYAEAGADIILAPTLGADRRHLGSTARTAAVNNRAVTMARAAAPYAQIASMVSMHGEDTSLQVREIITEQLCALNDAGADMHMLETLVDGEAARIIMECALDSNIRTGRDIPVHVSFAPIPGLDIQNAAADMIQYRPASIGLNCFCPDGKISDMLSLLPDATDITLRPAVSTPGHTALSPDRINRYFAPAVHESRFFGIGTCCGAGPEHTLYLKNLLTQ